MIIIKGGYTVTMDAARAVHEDGCVVVDDAGAIAWVGPAQDCPPAFTGEVLDARGMMVLPGFVNAGHALNYEAAGAPGQTPGQVALAAGQAAAIAASEMLRGGTTSALFLHPALAGASHVQAAVDAAAAQGLRQVQALDFRSQPGAGGAGAGAQAGQESQRLAQVMAQLGGRDPSGRLSWAVRVRTSAVDVAAQRTGEAAMAAAYALACAQDARLVTQTSASIAAHPHEWRQALQALGRTEITHLMELGLLDERWLVLGGEFLGATDVRLMAESGCHGAYSPLVEAMRGWGTGPWAALRASGVTCALATGDTRLHGSLDLLEHAKAALMIQNTVALDACALSAESCLEMATLAGAQALGLAARVGSLEPGKRADIVLFDLRKPYLQVAAKPVSALLACAGAIDVHTVLVDGIVRVRAGTPHAVTAAHALHGQKETA